MIPKPASPARSANTPSPNTTTPVDLKKSGAYVEWAKETDPKERKARTGRVPSANANIIRSPDINDPLERATTCID